MALSYLLPVLNYVYLVTLKLCLNQQAKTIPKQMRLSKEDKTATGCCTVYQTSETIPDVL